MLVASVCQSSVNSSRNRLSHVLRHRSGSGICSDIIRRCTPILVGLLLVTGCGKSGPGVQLFPVEGKLLLRGKPLANALVVLHPKTPFEKPVPPSRAQPDGEGKFVLSTFATQDGAPAGEFAMTVQAYKLEKVGEGFVPGPNILSPKLSTPESTDILIKIAEGPNTLDPIELRR